MTCLTRKQIINISIIKSYENVTGKRLTIEDAMRLSNAEKEKRK